MEQVGVIEFKVISLKNHILGKSHKGISSVDSFLEDLSLPQLIIMRIKIPEHTL